MAMLCTSIQACAYDFEVNGFYYDANVEKMTATLVAGENKQVGDIVIPEKVSYKGRDFDVIAINGAFIENYDLSSVTIPQSITSLGENAFEGCSSLKSISGIDNITEIGLSCFKGCSALTSITLPIQLKTIGPEAFSGCSTLSQIEIPENVTSIGNAAFSGCKSLKSIALPNSLTNLATGLFYECENLQGVKIPISTKSISDEVFRGCKSLTGISIPSAVEYIGDGVFKECSNLSKVIFEQSSTTIEVGCNFKSTESYYASPLFEDCNLTEAEIGRNIYSHSRTANNGFLGCFSYTPIQTVILSKNVTYLEDGAFYGCENLTNISIPNSITYIGYSAFYGSGLKSIIIEDGYDDLHFEINWSYNNRLSTFFNCEIENAYIGRTLTTSLDNLGVYNPRFLPTSLQKLTIGDYVRNIDLILMNNSKVTSSLSHYPNLNYVQFGTNLTKIPSLIDNSLLTHLSTSSSIPPAASPFSNSQYMDLTVEIPKGSLDAYKSAPVWSNFWDFSESSNLLHCIEFDGILYHILSENEVEVAIKDSDYAGDVIIPSTIEYNNISYKVISIGEAFKGCADLSSISIPPSVSTLDNICFANCVKLERVDINGNLKNIPYGAFYNCTNLSQIQIPQTVTRISGYAFNGCTSLKAFNCPEALTHIDESAFEGCSSITSFSFNNVYSIGQSALKECVQLKNVELNCNISVIPTECFSGCTTLENINNLQSIVRIENKAFENCKSIKAFDLPSIIAISSYAFENCSAANSFNLGDELEELGDNTFDYCTSLESLIIPGNVKSIGSSAFNGCYSLKDLTFKEGDAILQLAAGNYDGKTDIQKKEVNGKTIQFKIEFYKSAFDDLPIEKLFLGRNLSDAPRYTISGDGGVDYYLITSYDAPFNNLPQLKELTIGENVNILGPEETYISEVDIYETPGSFKRCYALEKVNVKNTTPPSGAEFSNTTYSEATLIVPDNTVSLYQAADGWKEFLNILDETNAGINDVYNNDTCSNISIGREGLTYTGESKEHIYIYGFDGKLYYSGDIEPNQSIHLANGLYIIRIKNDSIKIIINP